MFVIGYKGVKVHVQHCKVTHGGLNIIGEKELQIPVFVECLRICYEDWRLGMYNQRDDKLVIMHLDRAMKVNVKDE